MGLFKIRRELQFGVYNHPNPYPARKGELFYRGGNKGWEGYIMQSHGFSLSESLPGKRNISSFCWVGEGNGNPLHCSCLENPVDIQQQSLDCLCFIIWRQNFPDTADGSQSTISREWELFTWKFLPQDAAKKPRPLDSTRCSWGYCNGEGETELNKVGKSCPRLSFFFSPWMFEEFAAVCCIPCVLLQEARETGFH